MARPTIPLKEDLPLRNLALHAFINRTGLNFEDFAKGIGSKGENIRRIFHYDSHYKGEKRYPNVTKKITNAVAKKYGLSKDWLEREVDRLKGQKEEAAANDDVLPDGVAQYEDPDKRPFIFNTAHAGGLTEDLAIYSKPMNVINNLPYYDYTIQVIGDSMEPTYHAGDIIAIRDVTASEFKQWGCAHVLSTDQGVVLKRIYPDEQNKGYKCVSDNDKKYPPYTVPETSVFGVYKVVGSVHNDG